jgi:hypothetical protein
LFVDGRTPNVALASAVAERGRGAIGFVHLRLGKTPALLVGTRPLFGDELADSQAHVVVPRRVIPAVDLVDGHRVDCVVSFRISQLEAPIQEQGMVCGAPFSPSDVVAAQLIRRSALRDVAGLGW